MILFERLRKENDSVNELIHISNEKNYTKPKKKVWDEELVKAWWSDLPPVKLPEKHSSSYYDFFQKQQFKPKSSIKIKENRRFSKTNQSELKFFHFDQIKEYITHYRETVTLPGVMEYRKKLLALTTDRLSLCLKCAKSYSPHDLVKHCHCIAVDKKSNNLNSSSVCYALDNPISPISRNSPNVPSSSASYFNELRNSGSTSRRQLCWRNTPRSCERQPKKANSGYDRFCTSISLHKKDIAEVKQHKSLKPNNSTSNTIKFFTNSKMNLGPRMGSNYPPSNKSHHRYQHSNLLNTLRPKVPQAAIPGKSTSFQACIMPTSMSNKDKI